jgi:hypothetical protein
MKIHPVAEMFPLMEPGSIAFNELLDHVACYGQIEPIVMQGDVVLDGRNRLAVCERLKREPRTSQFSDLGLEIDIGEWIAGKNLVRRDLTVDQRVFITTEIERYQAEASCARAKESMQIKPGQIRSPGGRRGKVMKEMVSQKAGQPFRDSKADHARQTRGKIAASANVSTFKAEQAIKVSRAVEDGKLPPETKAAVKSGALKLKDAVKQIPKAPRKEGDLFHQREDLRIRVAASYRRLMNRFAACDLPKVREYLRELVK